MEGWGAKRIWALRDSLRLTQRGLARELGRSRGLVSAWETNRSHPNYSDCIQLERLEKHAQEVEDAHFKNFLDFAAQNLVRKTGGYITYDDAQTWYHSWCKANGQPSTLHSLTPYFERLGYPLEQRGGNYLYQGLASRHLEAANDLTAASAIEPLQGPGPSYAPIRGKLALTPHPPLVKESGLQSRLHQRLRAKAHELLATFVQRRQSIP